MPPSHQKPLALLHWGLVVILLIGAILTAATLWLSLRVQQEEGWVRHTLEVQNQIADVMLLVQRVETSQRGYLLTGRVEYLAPYENAAAALPGSIGALTRLVSDNPPEEQNSRDLAELVQAKLEELGATIEQRKVGNTEAALAIVNSDKGLRLMDQIRMVAADMQREEERLLVDRQARSKASAKLLQVGAGTAFLFICGIGMLVSFYTRHAFREVTTARDELESANRELLQEKADREQLEAQLRQAQKMEAIGQLTGGVAHDFNNMLGVIIGSLDLIQRRLKKGDFGIERFVESAHSATQRAAVLTHRLLAFARQLP
jgi:CHASE3 domain sensor protein